MPTVKFPWGDDKIFMPDRDEWTGIIREAIDTGNRVAQRGKKRMEFMVPGALPLASTFFINNLVDEGYIWSLRLLSVNLSAAGSLAAYKASTTGDTRRPLAVLGAPPLVTTATTAASQSVTTVGSQTSPAAGTTITSQALAAGTYTVSWSVQLSGTLAAPADVNNFGLNNGATLVATSLNSAVAGTYPQPNEVIVIPGGGATLAVKAIGNATTGAVYTSQLTTTLQSVATTVAPLTSQTATWSSDQARMRHSDGLYLVASSNITEVFISAWQVPAEMEGETYD